MAFLLPAFSTVRRGFHLVPVLCLIHITMSLFYFLYTNSGPSLFRGSELLSSQNARLATSPREDSLYRIFYQSRGNNVTADLPKCPETSPRLVGRLTIEFDESVTLQHVIAENPELQPGGRWRPSNCTSRQKVAIIIPFRDRESHLKHWLFFLHPILQRQQLDYRVYVINQAGDTTFNKARLMNAGVLEALKEYDYNCFVFSDVDIIPMDDRNIFQCYRQPRHLAVALDKFEFTLPYQEIFGGITALSKEQFMKINGFPTTYWGWGGEDDDIAYRLTYKGMFISRPDLAIGRCKMIEHSPDKLNQVNPNRLFLMRHVKDFMDHDGINSLWYEVVHINRMPLYTNITVDVGVPP